MPEQTSGRALPVTGAAFEQPFETAIYPYGTGGLNLRAQGDAVPVGQFQALTNLTHSADRGLTTRDGLKRLATGGTTHHSVRRLHNPRTGVDTRIWGIDTNLAAGLSGALTTIDSGYSGNPLTLLPTRPPLSGDPWLFVGDSNRMRKVRASDQLVFPIGLPAPSQAATTAVTVVRRIPIAQFDTGDSTQAASWIPFSGFGYGYAIPKPTGMTGTPGVPTLSDVAAVSGNGVQLQTTVGSLAGAGWTWGMGLAKSLDLSQFVADGTKTSDDDILHVRIRVNFPYLIDEIRIYLVCSGFTLPNPATSGPAWQLPGMGAPTNTSAYLRSFRPSDIAVALAKQGTNLQQAASTVQTANLLQPYADPVASASRSRTNPTSPTTESPASANAWAEFGVIGLPIRRGDFLKIGNAGQAGTDWSTISGIFITVSTLSASVVQVSFDEMYLTGGGNPDTSAPGLQPYDYRYTHFDPRTGAEGNPSPIQATTAFLDALRQTISVTPTAYGDSNIRQRIYRRGGSLIASWYYIGQNTADGAALIDNSSDATASTAGTVNLDHYQPVPTVDANGNTVYAQPVPILFGPVNGLLFALGDPYRPGFLYWSFPDQPDHWGAENQYEVCSPSEELMTGFLYGSQAFCFSRERLYAIYPSLTDTAVITVTPTPCRRGLVGRWAWALGMGLIFGVAKDGIFATAGGIEEVISADIEPLFYGKTRNGYFPVDFTVPNAIRLTVYRDRLYFLYQGTDGNRHVLVYSLLYKFWSAYEYGAQPAMLTGEDDTAVAALIVGGQTTGASYTADGATYGDDGVLIPCTVRTGMWDLGRPREDKLLGDQILDCDTDNETLTLTNRLNNESVTNAGNVVSASGGRNRFLLDAFGTTPQRARNISTEITWSSNSHRPTLYFMGLSVIPEPDQTDNRVTQWDDLGHPDESYVTGITFDCDTGNSVRTILIERDFGGVVSTVTTLNVQTNGRRKVKFSWPAVQAHKVRIRPTDTCAPWILYRADWISVPEPPRIAGWDVHFETDGDQYYTGLDLYCSTEGNQKLIQIQVDGATLTNPYTGEAFWRIITAGRSWVHLTLPWGRGHVFHFTAIDQNPGLLYRHKWYTQPEPSEQANWNQNFSAHGTLADKWFKGCLFEVDTFGQSKTVTIEVDGTVQTTLAVKTSGRKVVQLAFPQVLGRILRVYPTDGNPSRPYTITPLFDVEPYKLTRWETQETDHDVHGFHVLIDAHVTLRSTADVTLVVTTTISQTGLTVQDSYTIPSTGGIKDKRYVPFVARKGVLTKYLFTSSSDFHLFEEESEVFVLPWGGDEPLIRHPFGNDDLDRSRQMYNPDVAAARSGGMASTWTKGGGQ